MTDPPTSADEPSGPDREHWLDLHAVLRSLSVPAEDIERAEATGTLEMLALERILNGGGPAYDLDEVSAESGIERDHILALWRALGFPEPRPGEKVFSDADLEMLEDTVPFIATGGLDIDLALQMSRVIGSSVARIATSQVDAITSELDERRRLIEQGEEADAVAEGEVAQRAAELLPMMPRVMEFVWRRHLANAARRKMLRTTDDGATVCVGFADLVGFTAQTQQLEEHELADVVGRFEHIAHDVVAAHGGRVIKMIGDEVMFATDDVPSGAAIALAMADSYRNDEAFSDVRVGLAAGEVLERDGDLYGPVVNLASRIVHVAYPGAVVVAPSVVDHLDGVEDVVVRSIRSHYLKDIGKVKLYALRRVEDTEPAAGRYAPAQRRRLARREFLDERRQQRQRAAAALSRGLPLELPVDLGEEAFRDEPTEQVEAITDAVLEADLDKEVQVELLADIHAARRLDALEREAQAKADEADSEAERKILEAEREARRKVEAAERDARIRIEQALEEAEAKAARANEEASRKVKAVAKEAERRGDQAEKEAERSARRQAERQAARRRNQRAKAKAKETVEEVAEIAGGLGEDVRKGVEDAASAAHDAAVSALDAFRPPQSDSSVDAEGADGA